MPPCCPWAKGAALSPDSRTLAVRMSSAHARRGEVAVFRVEHKPTLSATGFMGFVSAPESAPSSSSLASSDSSSACRDVAHHCDLRVRGGQVYALDYAMPKIVPFSKS